MQDNFLNNIFRVLQEDLSWLEILGLYVIFLVALAGLIYAWFLRKQVMAKDTGTPEEQRVAGWIQEGADAYLKTQFRSVIVLVVILSIGMFLTVWLPAFLAGPVSDDDVSKAVGRGIAFLMGSSFSAATGYFGMKMAVNANVRVASASRRSLGETLEIAYRAGTVTGMLTDSLGLFGGTIIFVVYGGLAPEVLLGFGFGGTLLALFMRVGGGIYTKAADVGADLVGKVEEGLEEDDPRNAAVIADLVGDNVGDCAGMAADIFESYEVTIVASLLLGLALFNETGSFIFIMYPLLVRTIGVFASILGTYQVKAKEEGEDPFKAIERGYIFSAVLSIGAFFVLAMLYVGLSPTSLVGGGTYEWVGIRVFIATFSGIILAVLVNRLTDYYTGTNHAPVKDIARSSNSSAATNILSGLAVGMESSAIAILIIAGSIFLSFIVFNDAPSTTWIFYGVGLAGIGQLTLTGNNVAMDAFGPIADNANGIGEMTDMDDKKARQILADLDAVGNTTKAITKGIAIGSAVLAAVTLFGDFATIFHEFFKAKGQDLALVLNLGDPNVFIGLLIGGSLPMLFSALAIRSVGRAANLVIKEVRDEFKRPGVMERTTDPDYGRVVSICTSAAQKELYILGTITILAPFIVGFIFPYNPYLTLGGFLAGIILAGQLMAVFQANAGGAWDNAKKTIEDGIYGGKRSEAHKASVIGDTVGDPLKDTSGPALNPMIKVVNLVSIIILPLVLELSILPLEDPVRLGAFGVAILFLLISLAAFFYSSKQEGYQLEEEPTT
ncbi:MAG: sodium-translocating pyrophosphatase [Candidatus Hodarchaeales archaeon]|jgi:K(+)-stimulated pyrophosphate-energized sodium pump